MNNQKKLVVSHAPFLHSGASIAKRYIHIFLAALPAVLMGMQQYGIRAVGVIALSISSAMLWELVISRISRRPVMITNGQAALIGLLFGMLLPASMPWWAVLTGTFVAVVIGKEIFGGIGANPFNPVALSMAILMVSWSDLFDFNAMLTNFDMDFDMFYPLTAVKHFGVDAVADLSMTDMLMGRQAGGIGATFGLGLIAGGVYLMLRGYIRWEISVSFLAGILITALLFHVVDPIRYASPLFHIFTGYTLIGAFFLATEDSSSPVYFVPMLIYGVTGGVMTVLIRNIGAYIDGVILAILIINLLNPLLDKIRPKALGKVV